MKTETNQCRRIRKGRLGLWDAFRSRVLERLSDHIAECPRCQRRLATVNRVELGLTLMKTQPQQIGLLARANNQALDMLKHSLRHAPKSAGLRTAKSDANRLEKIRPGLERVLNVAACVFIVIMIKTGVSNSLLDYKEQGEAVIHSYYASNLDNEMFNEIFPDGPSPSGRQTDGARRNV
ncbi:MAG: hypothetical protein ACYSOF_00905 [Planctomycetota bacterium]|jgi:hypothetical protein